MKDGKIHIPVPKLPGLQPGQQAVVRLTAEAYNALIRLSNESGVRTKKIASEIIMQSLDRIEFTIEEAE